MSITFTGSERPKSSLFVHTIANSPFVRFGHTGLETIMKMRRVLNSIDPCFGLTYDKRSGIFSISNSALFSREFFEAVFAKEKYPLWKPKVSDTFYQDGNRIVFLEIDSSEAGSAFKKLKILEKIEKEVLDVLKCCAGVSNELWKWRQMELNSSSKEHCEVRDFRGDDADDIYE